MIKFDSKRVSLVLFLLFFSLAATFASGYARTTESIVAGWQSMQPIQGRLLVMLPRDIEGFVYGFSHKGGAETRLPVGDQVTDLLEKLLHSAFTSTTFISVPSEAAAQQMISAKDPELKDYDFIAIPRVSEVKQWDRGPEYGFDVDLSLDIFSFRTRTEETISGHGQSSTPESPFFTPAERLSTAVSYALDAIRDGIMTRSAAWSQ